MKTYIALFRGINVGGKNLLPMKALIKLLEDLGSQNVRTYIQSGNAVFRNRAVVANNLLSKLSPTIKRKHGFEPDIILLETDELTKVVKSNPFPEAEPEHKSLHVFFLASVPTNPDVKSLDAVKLPNESYALRGKAFYLHAPDGIGKSKLAARVEKSLGTTATARNWRTVCKLLELAEEIS